MKTRTCKSCHEEISGLGCKNCVMHINHLITMIIFFLLAILYYCAMLLMAPQHDDYVQTTTYVMNQCGSFDSCNSSTQIITLNRNLFQTRKIHFNRNRLQKSRLNFGIYQHACSTNPNKKILKVPTTNVFIRKISQQQRKAFKEDQLRLENLTRMQLRLNGEFIEL